MYEGEWLVLVWIWCGCEIAPVFYDHTSRVRKGTESGRMERMMCNNRISRQGVGERGGVAKMEKGASW